MTQETNAAQTPTNCFTITPKGIEEGIGFCRFTGTKIHLGVIDKQFPNDTSTALCVYNAPEGYRLTTASVDSNGEEIRITAGSLVSYALVFVRTGNPIQDSGATAWQQAGDEKGATRLAYGCWQFQTPDMRRPNIAAIDQLWKVAKGGSFSVSFSDGRTRRYIFKGGKIQEEAPKCAILHLVSKEIDPKAERARREAKRALRRQQDAARAHGGSGEQSSSKQDKKSKRKAA